MTILGTRSEAIDLAPVLMKLERRENMFRSRVCGMGRYRELLASMLEFFGIQPACDQQVIFGDERF